MNEKTNYLLETLGKRLKHTRLNRNKTQQEVADLIGKSRTAIEGAEKGKSTMDTFVSILMVLGVSDQLDLFLPEEPASPVLLAKALGKKRQRASGRSINEPAPTAPDDLGW